MTAPTSNYVQVLEREIHYMEWGAGNAEAAVLWHGLARTGRDMDALAAHLSRRYRVICPDTIGRGWSQWSPEPEREYCLEFYARLAAALADALGLDRFHWVGTSMGGAIGIVAAAGALKSRIRRMVLNDIGPKIAQAAVDRIRSYAGNPPAFATMAELEAYFRTIYKPYGYLSEAEWRKLTETSSRRTDAGKVTPHYDPKMVYQFIHHPEDYDLWPIWDRLATPTLVLRGAESDLLTPEVAEAMRHRGPCALLGVIPGCGHAPALNVPDQLELVDDFLAG